MIFPPPSSLFLNFTIAEFIYYLSFAILGQAWMVRMQIYKYWERIERYGGFQIYTLWCENWPRFGMTLFVLVISVLVIPKPYLNELSVVLAGATADTFFDRWINRKK